MPREIAHFLAVEYLIANSEEVKELVCSTNLGREIIYLGSITPDSPYYMVLGTEHEKVAEHIHGRNEADTFALLRVLKEYADGKSASDNKAMQLFVIGILTHVILDAVVHPYLNLVAGDYYDLDLRRRKDARTLHRRLETDLDNFLLKSKDEAKLKYDSLGQLRKTLKQTISDLSFNIDSALYQSNIISKYKKYWYSHSLIYSLLSSNLLGLLSPLLPKEIGALCGRRKQYHPLFKSRDYTYPNSENLFYKCLSEEIDVLSIYFLAKEKMLEEVLGYLKHPAKYLSLRGPSMEDGTI